MLWGDDNRVGAIPTSVGLKKLHEIPQEIRTAKMLEFQVQTTNLRE